MQIFHIYVNFIYSLLNVILFSKKNMSATWIDKDEDRTIAKWKCSLPADCPVEIVGKPKIVYRGQWTRTVEVHYRKRNSKKEEVSQSIHRKEISPGRAHGVEVIAILHKADKKYFVFVKEYRIPPAGYCFEFPAGLLEEGETVIDAARRELKEETGYTASKVTLSIISECSISKWYPFLRLNSKFAHRKLFTFKLMEREEGNEKSELLINSYKSA
uniref:Nudix hydrolase domain-containing protein n=1 Tax=Ascaris lumbricoides TaxID=6252 RepID=A0A0M3HH53_ASCLU